MSDRLPNAHLERLFRETGWTLRQFAQQVNRLATEQGAPRSYSPQTARAWLQGHMPRTETRPLIVEALARRLGRPVHPADAGFPAPTDDEAGAPSTVADLVRLGSDDMSPTRRGIVGAGLFSAALAIPNWPDVVGRMEAARKDKVRRIGMPEVHMVTAMTEHISNLDDQFGGRPTRPMAAALLVNTVAPYLQAEAPESVRKAMLSAAADLCYLTGYMAVDEGLNGLAQRYYVQALKLAGAADDHLTYCTTLRGMSVQAVDLGHGQTAMRLADAAAAASPQAGPRMRAFLAGQQAHAAALGNEGKALTYLREAEVAMEKAEARSKTFGSYDPPSLAYHVGQVRYAMGDIAGSIEALQESDRLRPHSFQRSRVRFLSMLAERQCELGHLEAACQTWGMAVDIYPKVQSGRCDSAMRTMHERIRPYRKNQTARDLYERARLVCPAPA
ncbi:tetratricopeptide repeat protein [Streptomyces buecherae]|uniref:tetratricopeptide repeat protein n=1 Tax=Streptomyces buecherae TaxID=2763006 RepID=UPI0033C698CD